MDVKILTLWQPHASAIACGLKPRETRGWSTGYRGWLLIHAAKKWDGNLKALWASLHRRAAEHYGATDPRVAAFGMWPPRGVIVAACRLCGCYPTVKADGSPLVVHPLDRAFGDYGPGRFALEMTDLRPIREPIPWTGRQGKLLEAPADLVSRVEAQIGRLV